MKKIVLTYGFIGGFISCIGYVLSLNGMDMEKGMVVGFASMLVCFSLIFVAIKSYRDKMNDGIVSFGKAFRIGLYISLIASSIYVIVWLIMMYNFYPDFADKYATATLEAMKAKGAAPAEIAKKAADMESFKKMYKKPVWVVLWTYTEILPIGLIVSLIAAAILKKKPQLSL